MNEPTTPPPEQSPDSTSSDTASSKGAVLGVIALLLVAAVAVWAAYIYITGKDGFSWRRFAFQEEKQPILVPATGQLFFNGKPMDNGDIRAYPVDAEAGGKMALAAIGPDGKFELMTDVDGLKPGALPGTYKLVLNVIYPNQPGQLAPTRRLPDKYYSASTTPVTITVTDDQEKNYFPIREEGEEAPPPGGRGGGRKKRGKRPSREEIIKRILAGDKDGDGRISRAEASDRLKSRFDQLDANQDGFLDKGELEAGLRFRKRQRKGSGRPE